MTGEDQQSTPIITELRERKKRARIVGKQYRYLRDRLWYDQASTCFYRFEGCTNSPDCIAHKDHNPSNNAPWNLAVSCRHCNATLTYQARLEKLGAKVIVSEKNRGVAPTDNLVDLSDRMHTDVEDWLMKNLGPGAPHKYLPLRFCMQEISHDCQVAGPTLYRYLVNPGDMTASRARWRLTKKRGLDPEHPNKEIKVLTWRQTLDDELGDSLQRVGRQEFVKSLTE